jgi:DNA invertase Pin-like site-specific DNA recombinase
LNVLITVAQWERETIGERTRDALQHKIRNGQRVGKVRYGFDLATDGVTLLENPGEQQIIAMMRDLRAAGRTLRQIAAELTARNIPSKEGNSQWRHQSIAYILRRAA